MTDAPKTRRKANRVKAHSGITATLKLTGLSDAARAALDNAPNKSALIRAALEAYVDGNDTRRAVDEIRAALARIESLLASGAAPAHAADASARGTKPEGDEDAEVLALLAGAVAGFTDKR